jgi:MFS family permease
MDEQVHAVPAQVRRVLGHGPLARYLAGEAVSMTGTWMQVMAQSWVMTSLTGSAAMMGMVNFAAGLPMIALAMVGGACADRHDRRHILLVTQVVQIALALLVGGLVASGQIRIWHILSVAFLLGISNSFEMPAASALVPELVPKGLMAPAIALDRSVFHGTRLIGPALAGVVIGCWGTASAFFLNALSFLALIVALLTLAPRVPGTLAEEERRRGGFKDGLSHVRSDQPTLGMIALMAATTVFVFPAMVVMLPLYARNVLGLGPDRMGLLMGISSLGSFTGALSLLAVPRPRRFQFMLAAVVVVAAALVSLSQARLFALAAASLVVLSLGVSTLIGLSNIIVQERAPSLLRGRVSAVAGLSFFGLMPFASLGITSVADWLGLRQALLLSGGFYLVVGLTVLFRARRRICELPPAAGPTSPD